MSKSLYEAYKNRLAISESVYGQRHNGAKMDCNRKMVVAKCIENVNKFLNESLSSGMATQLGDVGAIKKFVLNIATLAMPNLIAHDLCIVKPY